jgi:radical SAM protein with 4Fe4S-binding SPASM domain
VDGSVSICPFTYYRSNISYGKVLDGNFLKLWNCQELKRHRHQLRTGDILDVCNECPVTDLWRSQSEESAA